MAAKKLKNLKNLEKTKTSRVYKENEEIRNDSDNNGWHSRNKLIFTG